MVIGIDIDDTLTNHCDVWFQLFNDKYKPLNVDPITIADAYRWNFYDDYPEDIQIKLFSALDDTMYFENLDLKTGALNVIERLKDAGHQVLLISSTEKKYQEQKKNWILNKIKCLTEEDIIFTAKKQLINVDLMIDDNLAYASKFKCPFILFKRPWNTNRESNLYTDNVLICSNWLDITKYLVSQNVIPAEIQDDETFFSEETEKLINGIKEAKDMAECISVLNPYIKLWQEQGILIGISRMSDFLGRFAKDVDDEIRGVKN